MAVALCALSEGPGVRASPRHLRHAPATEITVPHRGHPTGTLDAVAYKIKPADGNLWSERYRNGRLIRGVCPLPRCIAFTFDDGPDWETTPTLLDELDRRGIHATFFVTGHRIDGDGEVARRNREVLEIEWRHGHLVGNHTYHHDVMDRMNESTLSDEIDRTEDLIRGVLGTSVMLFRAPYGALATPTAVRAVFSRGLTPVFWGMDSSDWRVHTPEAVLANVIAELDREPHGGVLLMHDTLPWSVAAFPLIVDEINRRNTELQARGESPYVVVGLESFYQPLTPSPTLGR